MINNGKTDDRPRTVKRIVDVRMKRTTGEVLSCKLPYPFHNSLSAWSIKSFNIF